MTTKQVGVLELASKYRYGLTSRGAPLFLFKPYDQDQPEYIVGSTERDTSRNQIALVETPPPGTKEKGRGTLLRLFGPVGDPHAEQAALLEYYCPNKHGKALMLDDEGNDENGWTTFHIDPPGCRDVDDAIAYHHSRCRRCGTRRFTNRQDSSSHRLHILYSGRPGPTTQDRMAYRKWCHDLIPGPPSATGFVGVTGANGCCRRSRYTLF